MAEVELSHLEKRYPNGTVALRDLSLTIRHAELMVFVGPSGCGKSTLLRLLAGLEEASAGHIKVGGRVVNDLGPRQRNVAMVFQNYALYPHMTVRRNIEFPLRMMKLPRGEARGRLERVAELLGLEPLLDARPRQLSGGQRQRVAMARALVRDPTVFLMDEPLSNLDAKLRVQIRTEILALQRRMATTTAYVTHDQVEAMTLGERVTVLDQGRLQQVGTPRELYEAPANTFVAGFIGSPPMNLVPTVLAADGDRLSIELGGRRLALGAAAARHPALSRYVGQRVIVGIRPEAIRCHGDDAPGLVGFDARVTGVENLGHEKVIFFESAETNVLEPDAEGAGARLAARCRPRDPVAAGSTVPLWIDMNALHFFTAAGDSL